MQVFVFNNLDIKDCPTQNPLGLLRVRVYRRAIPFARSKVLSGGNTKISILEILPPSNYVLYLIDLEAGQSYGPPSHHVQGPREFDLVAGG